MTDTDTPTILRIDASGRYEGSNSRALADHLMARLTAEHPDADIITRDVAKGLPFIDADWITANFTPEENRDETHRGALAQSDALIAELQAADIIVIGTPMYNFAAPASLKAWIDLVARARKTFTYTENGPVGLLENKKAYVAIATGGTEIGSDIDHLSGYMTHMLGFLGIDDVEIFSADQLMAHGEEKVTEAKAAIDAAV
ncbi:NAD(P)H-dependent oxidoreductase [Parasphingopyxis sp.]|uniref:FMN-dependent NADH-azoreductase n=1 Tax=Parasphingopyxis sp. TaxID=1920299 RepID=UPI0026392FCA|nr:NAD(P)H-dependent oxidoreductase [Parasphingopyxis sp.]